MGLVAALEGSGRFHFSHLVSILARAKSPLQWPRQRFRVVTKANAVCDRGLSRFNLATKALKWVCLAWVFYLVPRRVVLASLLLSNVITSNTLCVLYLLCLPTVSCIKGAVVNLLFGIPQI